MEKEEHIKYGPDSQMEKESEKKKERVQREKEKNAEKERKKEGERKKCPQHGEEECKRLPGARHRGRARRKGQILTSISV